MLGSEVVRKLKAPLDTFLHPKKWLAAREEWNRLRTKSSTEIVIEGYPRSANTYAVLAFEKSQKRPVKIAHHHHSPEQVLRGVRLRIPVCVLIRSPEGAVKSLLTRDRDLSPQIAIRKYINFYSAIFPYTNSIVVATFEQVIENFSSVIQRINAKFHTNFKLFAQNEKFEADIFAKIDMLNEKLFDGNTEFLSRPHFDHPNMQKVVDLSQYSELLRDARSTYASFEKFAR